MDKHLDRDTLIEALFALMLGAVFGYAVYAATAWPYKAALFPTIVGIPGVVLAVTISLLAFRRSQRPKATEKTARTGNNATDLTLDESLLTMEGFKRTCEIFAWILAAFVLSWLIGQKLALPLFVFAYMKLGSREGWLLSIGMTIGCVILLLGIFDYVVNVAWWEGELYQWLGIDPPF